MLVFVLYDGVVVVGGVGCVVLIPLAGVLLLWQSCAAGRGWGWCWDTGSVVTKIPAWEYRRYSPHHTLGDTLGCRQRDSEGVVGGGCHVFTVV